MPRPAHQPHGIHRHRALLPPDSNLPQIEWSTAKNPGGVLHARLQRAVDMEKFNLMREARVAARTTKRARSASPPGGPAAKRQERSAGGDAAEGAAAGGGAAADKPRAGTGRSRSLSRGRSGRGRSRSKDRAGRSRSRDRERDRDRHRDRSREGRRDSLLGPGAMGRDRMGGGLRDPRDMGPPGSMMPLMRVMSRGREPDVTSKRWDDVVRATSRGVMIKFPRPFVEDVRRVLYNIGGWQGAGSDAARACVHPGGGGGVWAGAEGWEVCA